MAQAFTVKVAGLQQFEANLKILREQFGVKTGGVINRGLMAGARVIRDDARRRAPVLKETAALRRAFTARGQTPAGHALSKAANKRIVGSLRNNIVAHYVRNQPLTVWVRVRTKTWIFGEKKQGRVRKYRSGWVAAPGGTDPSNLVGNPNYWWLVEFGTSRMSARPFLRPAFEAKKHEALKAFESHMRKEIDSLFKKNLRMAA